MVQAYILIQTEMGKANEVSAAVGALPGVVAAQDVTGGYDVIVRVETASVDDLGALVLGQIQQVPGIARTQTCTVVHV
ncbi:Lrp/AsnC family transcriptional regulator [Dermacoccaceae bacterium W4C1]